MAGSFGRLDCDLWLSYIHIYTCIGKQLVLLWWHIFVMPLCNYQIISARLKSQRSSKSDRIRSFTFWLPALEYLNAHSWPFAHVLVIANWRQTWNLQKTRTSMHEKIQIAIRIQLSLRRNLPLSLLKKNPLFDSVSVFGPCILYKLF